MERLNSMLQWLESKIAAVLIFCMLILGFLQVFSRFILKSPIPWTEAMLTYMFVWFSFIGASLAVAEKAHFSVEIVVARFNPLLRRCAEILVEILIISLAVLMIYKGMVLVLENRNQLMAAMPFTMSWPYLALPVSGLFIMIHALTHIIRLLNTGGE